MWNKIMILGVHDWGTVLTWGLCMVGVGVGLIGGIKSRKTFKKRLEQLK